jgi:hypothetical protein
MERDQLGRFETGTHWREPSLLWDKGWLETEYLVKKRRMAYIATDFSVSEPAVRHWIRKHGITSRNVSEARKVKHWGAYGEDNPMWNKRGELSPNWKGGSTPERQSFYESREWKDAVKAVWKRDAATCRRCGLNHDEDKSVPFHIHHIKSFSESVELRADIGNLLLVCSICHHWIHSKKNVDQEYLK